ncbi:hypothetical protein L1049_007981 [Liquidambar formosana]|uniref:Cation/H(+) antiporter C-terminal domain-containing protein n=1 Tax=Liquidambar formosana TaxID=63359 RepID=A0AAP0S2A7_LIQFO
MVFLGGPDDREALAYATRMAEHPTIRLTVLRIIAVGEHSDNLTEKRLDMNAINDFRISTIDKKRIVYKEEGVTGAAGTTRVVTSLDTDDYELILVGRRHDSESPLVNGLAEWKEIEELGVIGDMLGSSDFKSKASVLVVQQQALVVEEMVESQRFIAKQLQ